MSIDILFVLSNGFAARMVLQTGVIPHLQARGLRVAALMVGVPQEQLDTLGAELDVQLERAEIAPTRVKKFLSDHYREYLSDELDANPALNIKDHQRRASNNRVVKATAKVMSAVNRQAFRHPKLLKNVRRWAQRLYCSSELGEQIATMSPRLVVTTYPVNYVEAAALAEAKAQGIPTLGYLLSWDNITSKGRFPIQTDYYISWGPIMTEELQEHYGTRRERIFECGISHFDKHLTGMTRTGVSELLESLGLCPAKPYLFFGMSSASSAPREIDIVEWLAAEIENDAFGDTMQLVVRPHPQNMHGNMADQSWLPRLERIESRRVAVHYPQLKQSGMDWDMKPEDLPRLATSIHGCSVCLNTGSTISIDGIVQDKPVIMTAFDPGEDELPWWRSSRRGQLYPHIVKLVAMGGVTVVDSLAELAISIRRYLDNPELHSEGRARTRQRECGICDGNASFRIAEAFAKLIQRLNENSEHELHGSTTTAR